MDSQVADNRMTQTFTTYRLSFTAPLHIGDYKPNEYGSSERHIHSDTFIAALMAVRKVYDLDIPDDGKPGFVISSLFPYITGGTEESNVTYFFPKPITGIQVPEGRVKWVKKVKKVAWIDHTYLSKLLTGDMPNNFGSDNLSHIRGNFLSSVFENVNKKTKGDSVAYGSEVLQRVNIPRLRSDAEGEDENQLFAIERVYFKENAGLYFLFDGNDQQKKWLEDGLNLLSMEGVGTDRNIGHGTFEWKTENISIEVPKTSSHVMVLGLFHPENQDTLKEQIDDKSAWKLIKRGGWITDPAYQTIRKRSVYMFSEGSVFKRINAINGTMGLEAINLQPQKKKNEYPVEHPIWRCGRCLALPIKLN
jgi:CRISPR type III-A-associated RAMP protein Csm4